MLLEMAIGDAFGAGREYADPAEVAANNDGKTYVQHKRWEDLTPGRYTDDTQMAVGLAEFLLSGKPMNTITLARSFVAVFKRDQRAGYAGGFYKLLKSVKNGTELMQQISPYSDKSGGAMRAAPCGLLATVDEVRDLAMWQASVTHATRDGMNAAAASALLVYACRQGCDQGYLPSFLNDTVPGYRWDDLWQGPVGAPGIQAVRAALTALVDGSSLSDILVRSIAFTGDVDTVAAIALAAASTHPSIRSDLHSDLYQGLENGAYGFSFLKKMDAALLKAFPLPTSVQEEPEDDTQDSSPTLDLFGN